MLSIVHAISWAHLLCSKAGSHLLQEEFWDDPQLPADVLDEQFERAQKFVARHVPEFEPIRHDVLQVSILPVPGFPFRQSA